MKKSRVLLSALLSILLILSGCTASKKSDKLVIWTLAEDLKQFSEKYTEETGEEIEVVVIAPADYSTKLTSALNSKSSQPDIIVGEPQMLPTFFEAGYFANLEELGATEDLTNNIVDYVVEAGKDKDGTLRALSYQITPGSVIYRRDLAKEVWGNDDPEFISEKYKDFDSIVKSSYEIREKGYHIFADSGNLRWFANSAEPWVKDNKLVLSDARLGYLDTAVELYEKELVAFAPEWSAAWYSSMAGELPFDAGWEEDLESVEGDTTQIMSYVLPSWGALIVRDNAKENIGKFGIAKGPSSFFGGGTFIGVNEYSKQKEKAFDFVKFATLSEDTANWWLDVSGGDVVSYKSVLEGNADYENASFGNQKTYEFYLKEAENIDYSLVTEFDAQIDPLFGAAIESVQKGEKTKEEALNDFYTEVKAVFPDIQTP